MQVSTRTMKHAMKLAAAALLFLLFSPSAHAAEKSPEEVKRGIVDAVRRYGNAIA